MGALEFHARSMPTIQAIKSCKNRASFYTGWVCKIYANSPGSRVCKNYANSADYLACKNRANSDLNRLWSLPSTGGGLTASFIFHAPAQIC